MKNFQDMLDVIRIGDKYHATRHARHIIDTDFGAWVVEIESWGPDNVLWYLTPYVTLGDGLRPFLWLKRLVFSGADTKLPAVADFDRHAAEMWHALDKIRKEFATMSLGPKPGTKATV